MAAVQCSGALGFMASHGDINGVLCHSNKFLLIYIMALNTGMDLYSEKAYSLIPSILEKKPEFIEYVDNAVRRALKTKIKLGLFDNPNSDESKVCLVRDSVAVPLVKKTDE